MLVDFVESSQIVKRRSDIWVIGTEQFLLDRQRPLVQWLGISVAALGLVERSQIVQRRCHKIVQRRCHIGMAKTQRLFVDR